MTGRATGPRPRSARLYLYAALDCGAASREDCVFDLFFGVDYHSHLGTRRAGMAVYSRETGFDKAIHNIENAPFRTKFEKESTEMHGQLGIGCISDFEAQPILVRSHHGTFAVTTVGKINNMAEILRDVIPGNTHFFEMANGEVNPTELVAAIIDQKEKPHRRHPLCPGDCRRLPQYARPDPEGDFTPLGINSAGRRWCWDRRKTAFCASFESFAYLNLGYTAYRELGPGEVVVFDENHVETLVKPGDKMKICTFLWIYYGYPSSSYEGSASKRCATTAAGCSPGGTTRNRIPSPASPIPAPPTRSDTPTSRASLSPARSSSTTPTWPRSFMPTYQSKRDLIAKMKLIPVQDLIEGRSLLLIDDSIVRGTQTRETTEFLYASGAKEVHIRPRLSAAAVRLQVSQLLPFPLRDGADCPPGDLRTGGGTDDVSTETVKEYANPDSEKYQKMVDMICEKLHFTSLRYHRLDDMIESVGIEPEKLCTLLLERRGIKM